MKQIVLTFFLILFMSMVGMSSFAQFSGTGSGTENDPYIIQNPIQLNQMRHFLNTKVFFKLMNDIDLTEFLEEENPSQGWLPIGDCVSYIFKGVLDGNGKTIKGLWIKRPSTECVGIFTCMEHATIKDLTIEAANIEGLSGGIIAGTAVGNITITGCSVSGAVKGKSCLGGYVGELHKWTDGTYYIDSECYLTNNISKVSVIGTGECVGGFAGYVSAKPIMSDCTFYDGDVRGTNNVGGLFGKATGRFTGQGVVVNITHCGFIGEIAGTSNVGGLIGLIKHDEKLDFENSSIKNCFSISNIDATGDNVGGLIGYDNGYSTSNNIARRTYIDNNYYSGSVNGANNVGGIVGYKKGAEITSCLATGSVEGSSYVGGIIGYGQETKVLKNVAINTQVTATTDKAKRIGYSTGTIGLPATTDENKAYNKVVVTVQGVVQDIVDSNTNGTGVGAFTLKQKATYVAMGFDFDNIWEISDGEGYPYIIGSTQMWPGDPETTADTDISSMNNVIYLNKVESKAGGQINLSIRMKNTVGIRGFQFDMYLPEGVTVVKSAKGKIMGSLSNGRLPEDDDHSLTLSELADGAINFLCGSLYDETFTGNDGEIATLTIKIDENLSDGDYPIILKNMKLEETDINKYYQTDFVKSTLTIKSYTLGDINGDSKVDALDIQTIINACANSETDVKYDMNNDGKVDALDIQQVINVASASK